MRIDRSIDRYLAWRQLERDATPGSLDTYWRALRRLADDHPDARLHDFEGRPGTELIRQTLARHWGSTAASTRANAISVLSSFFSWAEAEDLIESNPARRIRRPPTRKPDIYRPEDAELAAIRRAASVWERPAILLMEGAGLRASEVCRARWSDVDLTRARLRVKRKGGGWQTIPLLPDVRAELRVCHRAIEPQPDWHVFVVRRRGFSLVSHTIETVRDPLSPSERNSLWYLLERICKRAGTRRLSPHQLRHGFAVRLRRAGYPVDVIQFLLGHQRLETTRRYLDELRIDDVEQEIEARSQASADVATDEEALATSLPGSVGTQYASGSDPPDEAESPKRDSTDTGPEEGHK